MKKKIQPVKKLLREAIHTFCPAWLTPVRPSLPWQTNSSLIVQRLKVTAHIFQRDLRRLQSAHSLEHSSIPLTQLCQPSVPDQIVTQRPESHNAHIVSVIGDGRKMLEHRNTHTSQPPWEAPPTTIYVLERWNTRLFHWNTRATPSVPDQMCTQRPETHNAHIFSVI